MADKGGGNLGLRGGLSGDGIGGLPPDLYHELSWLAVVHDHIAYPTRKRKSPEGNVLKALDRIAKNRQLLERFASLGEQWNIPGKGGKGEISERDVRNWLEDDGQVLMKEGVYPCLNALYMILYSGFTVSAPDSF